MKIRLNKALLKDVLGITQSIYRLNAPYAVGYGFNPTSNRRAIACGMFLDESDDATAWEYYFDLKTGEAHNWK